MIMSRLNLKCSKGHRFFAPNPRWWSGRQCAKELGRTSNGKIIHCQGKLS